MICDRLKPAVSGLQKEFSGQVTARNLNATTPESLSEVQLLGFSNHGLVIKDSEGKVLFKQADHTVEIEAVRSALREILAS